MSSLTTAVSVSGFKDQFLFYGFLPKKEKELETVLLTHSSYTCSQVFFVPAVKINFFLKKFKKFFNGRKIMIAREITKIHEVFYRENINDMKMFNNSVKGELTIVISEKLEKNKSIDTDKIINKAKKFLKKYSLRDTVDLILETEKFNKKKIYEICLKIKNEKNN